MTPGKAGIEGMFQSLFLWNSRPDGAAPEKYPYHFTVSILVFVELAPGPCVWCYESTGCHEFQSLFLWNSRPDSGLHLDPPSG